MTDAGLPQVIIGQRQNAHPERRHAMLTVEELSAVLTNATIGHRSRELQPDTVEINCVFKGKTNL